MATTVVSSGAIVTRDVPHSSELSGIERYVLRRSHPVSICFEIVGLTWFIFYFWNHLWVEAIIVYSTAKVLGALAVSRVDVHWVSKSLLGRVALLHLAGSNLILQAVGFVTFLSGIWLHESRIILVGASLYVLGHVQGWGKVDGRLETR